MTYWETSSFKALQADWYRRLKEDGFQDAERVVELPQPDGTTKTYLKFKRTSSHAICETTVEQKEQKEAYFRLLGQLVHVSEYESEVDRLILNMFADGERIKKIVETLALFGTSRGRDTVRWTIRKYEMRWGLKEYTQRQLHREYAGRTVQGKRAK